MYTPLASKIFFVAAQIEVLAVGVGVVKFTGFGAQVNTSKPKLMALSEAELQ